MKTTIDIVDDLLVRAKQLAAEERKPLRRIVEEGLALRLSNAVPGRRSPIQWVTVPGGVPEATGSREAMYEWLERHT